MKKGLHEGFGHGGDGFQHLYLVVGVVHYAAVVHTSHHVVVIHVGCGYVELDDYLFVIGRNMVVCLLSFQI